MGLEFYIHSETAKGLKFQVTRCYRLLNSLLNYYVEDDGIFVFNDNIKLCYSLQDVFFLTGLPINGKPVTGSTANPSKQFVDAFGFEASPDLMDTNGIINLRSLKAHFQSLGENPNDPHAIQHVRAYMLYFIHSFIIPGLDGKAPSYYLPLLEDVSRIHEYSWGSAALVNVNYELNQVFSSRNQDEFRAQLSPLLLFFFEHIPSLLNKVLQEQTDVQDERLLPMKFPLMAEWSHMLHGKTVRHGLSFDDILENLTEDDVEWRPYQRLGSCFVPSDYKELGMLAITRTTLHCFHKCCYHRPDLAPKQFGLDHVDESRLQPMIQIKVSSNRSPKGKDFSSLKNKKCDYPLMLSVWHNRQNSDISLQMEPENDERMEPDHDDEVPQEIENQQINDNNLQMDYDQIDGEQASESEIDLHHHEDHFDHPVEPENESAASS